jgi:hypothetical protein
MAGASSLLLILFIAGMLLYNYASLCVSRKHGAKTPWWPSVTKSKITHSISFMSVT